MTLLHILLAAVLYGLFDALPVGLGGLNGSVLTLSHHGDGWLALRVALWAALGGASLLVCWRSVAAMALGLARMVKGRKDAGARLFLHTLICAAVPVIGYGLWTRLGGMTFSATTILTLYGVGAVALLLADHWGVTVRRLDHMTASDSLMMGGLMLVGLIPGIGQTTALVIGGRLLGYERADLLRLSLLSLSPLFLIKAVEGVVALSQQGRMIFSGDLLMAFLVCGLCALASLGLSLRWLDRRTFLPLVLVRLAVLVMAVVVFVVQPSL